VGHLGGVGWRSGPFQLGPGPRVIRSYLYNLLL
jgi:hypothetical protein